MSGYDLNITVSDINGNIAFMEKHINSLWEDFVAWLLDGIHNLCQFIAELASKAIEWIWDAITAVVSRAFDPIKNAVQNLYKNISSALDEYEVDDNGIPTDNAISKLRDAVLGNFFIGLIILFSVFLLVIQIISFFIPWMAWLLTAVLVLALSILTIYLMGRKCDGNDFDTENKNSILSDINEDDYIKKEMDWEIGDKYDEIRGVSIDASKVISVVKLIWSAITLYLLYKKTNPVGGWNKIKQYGWLCLSIVLFWFSLFLFGAQLYYIKAYPNESDHIVPILTGVCKMRPERASQIRRLYGA